MQLSSGGYKSRAAAGAGVFYQGQRCSSWLWLKVGFLEAAVKRQFWMCRHRCRGTGKWVQGPELTRMTPVPR